MLKRILLAVVVVFIVFGALDFVLHGLILGATYRSVETRHLWRPEGDMMKLMPLMYLVTLAKTICFVWIYGLLVDKKSLVMGIKYGVLFGLATGIPMGFGSYTHMAIPMKLAVAWSVGTLVGTLAAGVLLGLIVKARKVTA